MLKTSRVKNSDDLTKSASILFVVEISETFIVGVPIASAKIEIR
ncbi:hypothetical protein MHTCC0001_37560 [Flavobacteriaceae bacterium MHTCC 0001]